jgi:hypothetical protein
MEQKDRGYASCEITYNDVIRMFVAARTECGSRDRNRRSEEVVAVRQREAVRMGSSSQGTIDGSGQDRKQQPRYNRWKRSG